MISGPKRTANDFLFEEISAPFPTGGFFRYFPRVLSHLQFCLHGVADAPPYRFHSLRSAERGSAERPAAGSDEVDADAVFLFLFPGPRAAVLLPFPSPAARLCGHARTFSSECRLHQHRDFAAFPADGRRTGGLEPAHPFREPGPEPEAVEPETAGDDHCDAEDAELGKPFV